MASVKPDLMYWWELIIIKVQLNIKIYYISFDKQGKLFDKNLKELIIGTLFGHILKNNKEETPTVISDLDFLGNLPSYFSLEDDNIEKVRYLEGKKEIKFKKVNYEDYRLNKEIKDKIIIKVEPINSRLSEELQAVDLICGGIFQFLENNNSNYYNIIKDKIIKGIEIKE